MRIPSPQEIAAAVTEKGGWTKEKLAEWGVSWPPPRGWKRDLERRHAAEHGVAMRRAHIPEFKKKVTIVDRTRQIVRRNGHEGLSHYEG